MIQPFELSNNAISFFLSVFTAIIGLTYPLLLEAIQKIDEQYGSSRISQMLTREPCFLCFQCSVVISIAFAFISIFILQILDGYFVLTIVWIALHSLVTLSLLIVTLSLIYLILKYYHADELLDRIQSRIENERE